MLTGIEGPGGSLIDLDDWLDDPARREALLRAIRRVESEASMVGASSHILAVGAKVSLLASRLASPLGRG